VPTKSSILLTVCLINFSWPQVADADQLNTGAHGARQKLSDSPVDFKVEEHKAEQKLVFKLGLPISSPPEFIQNASKVVLNTFHQWGAQVEKACHNLDHFLKTSEESAKALPVTAKHATNTGLDGRGAKLSWPGRSKAIAERQPASF
jgi:hypothetical protein